MKPETNHLLNVLRSAIRVLGYTFNDVAQKMGVGSGYLSRLFAGKIELKVDHVVDIARAIGFEPEEIFHLAFPRVKEPRSRAAQQYLRLMAGDLSSPGAFIPSGPEANLPSEVEAALARAIQRLVTPLAPPPPSQEDLERAAEQAVQKLFARLAQERQTENG